MAFYNKIVHMILKNEETKAFFLLLIENNRYTRSKRERKNKAGFLINFDIRLQGNSFYQAKAIDRAIK